jgi:hypothetical protein
MHREVEWMAPADEYILGFLGALEYKSSAVRIKPASIALNLPYSPNWIGQRCRALAEHALLNSAEGGYWISDRGRAYLAGELGPEDLREE